MITQEVDLNTIRPHEYLKEGFLSDNGELRDGMSGLNSLALAYQLLEEGTSVEFLKSILDDFTKLADQGLREENKNSELDARSFELLGKSINSPKAQKSQALKNLFNAALPWLKDWPNVAGLVIHLDRAMKQVALIKATSKQ